MEAKISITKILLRVKKGKKRGIFGNRFYCPEI
jgi:hypothetical protein